MGESVANAGIAGGETGVSEVSRVYIVMEIFLAGSVWNTETIPANPRDRLTRSRYSLIDTSQNRTRLLHSEYW